MIVTSRKLTTQERHRRDWPMFERWMAVVTLPCAATGKGYAITRRQAERLAEQRAHAAAKARRTQRTTTR